MSADISIKIASHVGIFAAAMLLGALVHEGRRYNDEASAQLSERTSTSQSSDIARTDNGAITPRTIDLNSFITETEARAWAINDPHAFLAHIISMEPQPKQKILESFFDEWIKYNPTAAFEAACSLPTRLMFRKSLFFTTQYYKLLEVNPNAVIDWFGPGERRVGSLGIVGRASRSATANARFDLMDKERVKERLISIHPTPGSLNFFESYVRYLCESSPVETIQWMLTLPEPYWDKNASAVLTALYRQSPERLWDILEDAPSALLRTEVGYFIANSEVARLEPEKTLMWFEREMGTWSHAGTGSVLSLWVASDVSSAVNYAQGIRDRQKRESAFQGIAGALVKRDLNTALQLGKHFSEGDQSIFISELVSKAGQHEVINLLERLNSGEMDSEYVTLLEKSIIRELESSTALRSKYFRKWIEGVNSPASTRVLIGTRN